MLSKIFKAAKLTGTQGCQIEGDLKTTGLKEDPGACKTTPFAQMISAKNFKVLKKGFT